MRTVLLIVACAALTGCSGREPSESGSIERVMEAIAWEIVGRDGTPSGALWGSWGAEAGDTDVRGTTLLSLTGTGVARVQLLDTHFRGVDDASQIVPIEGNVRLAWATPGEAWSYSDGASLDVPLTAGVPVHVDLVVREVGSPLVAQGYAAPFDVRELASQS